MQCNIIIACNATIIGNLVASRSVARARGDGVADCAVVSYWWAEPPYSRLTKHFLQENGRYPHLGVSRSIDNNTGREPYHVIIFANATIHHRYNFIVTFINVDITIRYR